MSAEWISFEVGPSGGAGLMTVTTAPQSAGGIDGGWPFPGPDRRSPDGADGEPVTDEPLDHGE